MTSAPDSLLDIRRCGSVPISIGVVSTIIVIAFFPGVMINDSEAALQHERSLEPTDWHPPIMALLWRYLDVVSRGPLLILVALAYFARMDRTVHHTRHPHHAAAERAISLPIARHREGHSEDESTI